MTNKFQTLDELFREEEEKRLAKHEAEMEAERAAYEALSPEEKQKLWEESEARWAKWDEECQASEEQESEEDDEDTDEDEEEI